MTDSHAHAEKALRSCGYPQWTFRKVRDQMTMKTKKNQRKNDLESRRPIVLPCVKGTSERVVRVMKRHRVPVTMRPVKLWEGFWCIWRINKRRKKSQTVCTCDNCDKTYIGETGRKFGTRLKERETEAEATTNKPFTRSQRLSSLSEQNKSTLTDLASHDNHVINWPASTILDREYNRSTRWTKEAVYIRKEGWRSMNRDEGSYTLSHTYDRFFATSHHYLGKNGRRPEQASSNEGLW